MRANWKTKALEAFRDIDRRFIYLMSSYGIPLLRITLAVVFIWFGALKIFGASPVRELVAQTVYWVSPVWFVPFLGFWEIAIGIGLLFRLALRLTLFLLFAQLAGTFMILPLMPEVAFQGGNPLRLTVVGEFVVKNLVLLAAAIVIGGTVEQEREQVAQDNPQTRR